MDVVSGVGCSTCILWTCCLALAVARASCRRGVHPVDVVSGAGCSTCSQTVSPLVLGPFKAQRQSQAVAA